MNREDRVAATHNKVRRALGENYKVYLANLKLWFRRVWTKEQFDMACRKLFSPKQTYLHNQFCMALLNKIQKESQEVNKKSNVRPGVPSHTTANGQNGKQKLSSPPKKPRVKFEPIDLYDYLPTGGDTFIRQPDTPFPQPRYSVQEIFLPDIGMVFGRIMVTAWEHGLLGTGNNVCELLVVSTHTFLKNVLTTIIQNRKSFRSTAEGQFIYDIGVPFKDPTLRNTVTRQKLDDFPVDIDKEIISTLTDTSKIRPEDLPYGTDCDNYHLSATITRITVEDVYNILQDHNIIPCHSVYALNMERMSQMLQ